MAVVETQILWRTTSVGPGRGGIASTNLHDTQGTMTSVSSQGDHTLFDNALGGGDGDHDGKYLAILNGPSALYGGRVERYLAGEGRFVLDTPLPASVQIGDAYRLFPAGALVYQNTPALDCAQGEFSHAAVIVENTSGAEVVNSNLVWVKPINPGPVRKLEIFVEDNVGSVIAIPTFTDRAIGPSQASLDLVDPNGDWAQPLSAAQALFLEPRNETPQTSANGQRPMYLRGSIDPQTQAGHAAYMLVFQYTDLTPTTRSVPAIITMDFDGFTPDITLRFDRRLFIGGGARVDAQINVGETGEPAVDIDVGFKLKSPSPGSLEAPSSGTTTDAEGRTYASYTCSTDPVDEGETVEVEVRL